MSGLRADSFEVDSNNQRRLPQLGGWLLACVAVFAFSAEASAQDDADFYKGKTITIGVGAAPGGGLDTYARLVARHLGNHIAGKPAIVISNMPGAGGQVVARHLWASAAKDGTHMATFFPSVLISPLLSAKKGPIDPSKFEYVGNARTEVSVCLIRRDAAVKSVADLRTTEVVLGATSPGSQVVDYPLVESRLLGLKFKIASGYKGTRDIAAAIEKGEVQGICGIGWSSIKVQYPDIKTPTSKYRILVQEDFKGSADLNAAGVPLMSALVTSAADKEVLGLLYAQNELARPYVLPPGVPKARVELLRAAFMKAAADPQLQAETRKMRIDVDGTSGEDMQKLISSMYATPKSAVDRLAGALRQAK